MKVRNGFVSNSSSSSFVISFSNLTIDEFTKTLKVFEENNVSLDQESFSVYFDEGKISFELNDAYTEMNLANFDYERLLPELKDKIESGERYNG